MSTIWTPLHKAFEHVLQHERSRELTEYRLRRVLGTPKSGPQVRSRAGVVLTPMQPQRELENVMLPGEFWLEEAVYDGEADGGAIVNWQEDSARLSASHPFAPWLAYRIEVCREDLLAVWTAPPEPEDSSKQHEATAIARQVKERAAKLKGTRAPVTRAWAEVAQEIRRASGPTLNRWVRRHR